MRNPSSNTDSDDDNEHACRISITGAESNAIDPRLIVQAIRATLDAHGRGRGTLSVALVDDARMAKLHEQFMDDPTPTDVLTFDLGDRGHSALDGEIVISVETAHRESQDRGHALSDEVLLYAVHGTLHLLGYDDHSEHEAREMHLKENEILTRLGLGSIYGEVP